MSSDFARAIRGASIVLAATHRLCPTYHYSYHCSYGVDIGFALLAGKEGYEEACSGWVPESNRH